MGQDQRLEDANDAISQHCGHLLLNSLIRGLWDIVGPLDHHSSRSLNIILDQLCWTWFPSKD